MSYDVHVGDYHTNHTYNCANLGSDFGLPVRSIDGRKGSVVARMIREWDQRLTYENVNVSMWDASNGWGTGQGFRDWMLRLADACEKFPQHKVFVY